MASHPSDMGSKMRDGLARALKQGEYSDFTIHCQGKEWAVHRVLLAAQSTFFEKMFTGGFKESEAREVRLDDDSDLEIDLMLAFFYTGTYSIEHSDCITNEQQHAYSYERSMYFTSDHPLPISLIELHAHMYVLADKYGCDDLGFFALDELQRQRIKLGKEGENWIRTFAKSILAALPYVYENSPPGDMNLRRTFVKLFDVERRLGEPSKGTYVSVIPRKEWEGIVQRYPAFAADMISRLGCLTHWNSVTRGYGYDT